MADGLSAPAAKRQFPDFRFLAASRISRPKAEVADCEKRPFAGQA